MLRGAWVVEGKTVFLLKAETPLKLILQAWLEAQFWNWIDSA